MADAWRNLPTEGGVVRLADDPQRLRAWTRVLLSLRIAYLATWVPACHGTNSDGNAATCNASAR